MQHDAALAVDHQPRGAGKGAVIGHPDVGGGAKAQAIEVLAQQRQRMPSQSETEGLIVGGEILAFAGRAQQRRWRFHPDDFPRGLVAVAGDSGKRAGTSQQFRFAAGEFCPLREILDGTKAKWVRVSWSFAPIGAVGRSRRYDIGWA